MNEHTDDDTAALQDAERLLAEYGALLADANGTAYAMPQSLLPADKDRIKQAIQRLLWELGDAQPSLAEGLVQGYGYLAQFISDEEAQVVERGRAALASGDPHHPDWADAEASSRILGRIKAEMENLLQEIRLFAP